MSAYISGIILASGYGRRANCDKLMFPWQGKTLLFQAIMSALFSSLNEVILVIQPRHEKECREYIALFPHQLRKKISLVINTESLEGMAASVRYGMNAVSQKSEAYLFMHGDQPFFEAKHIDIICKKYNKTKSNIIAPYYNNERKNPVLFSHKFNDELKSVSKDAGARHLLQKYADEIEKLHFNSKIIFEDIDTIADYNSLNLHTFSWNTFIKDSQTVSIMGGGGKTSLLFSIAESLKKAKRQCVLSTTTKMWNGAPEFVSIQTMDFPKISDNNIDKIPLLSKEISDEYKLIGYDTDVFDSKEWKNNSATLILEADGSQGKNFKIHTSNEPCIPKSTDLAIAVIGMECIGKSIENQTHREELIPVTLKNKKLSLDILNELLFAENGYFKYLSPYNHILFLNHKESKTAYNNSIALIEKIMQTPNLSEKFMGIVYGSNTLQHYTFIEKKGS